MTPGWMVYNLGVAVTAGGCLAWMQHEGYGSFVQVVGSLVVGLAWPLIAGFVVVRAVLYKLEVID